jgi:hypothetical protein
MPASLARRTLPSHLLGACLPLVLTGLVYQAVQAQTVAPASTRAASVAPSSSRATPVWTLSAAMSSKG